jgi:hypothetical protein
MNMSFDYSNGSYILQKMFGVQSQVRWETPAEPMLAEVTEARVEEAPATVVSQMEAEQAPPEKEQFKMEPKAKSGLTEGQKMIVAGFVSGFTGAAGLLGISLLMFLFLPFVPVIFSNPVSGIPAGAVILGFTLLGIGGTSCMVVGGLERLNELALESEGYQR